MNEMNFSFEMCPLFLRRESKNAGVRIKRSAGIFKRSEHTLLCPLLGLQTMKRARSPFGYSYEKARSRNFEEENL